MKYRELVALCDPQVNLCRKCQYKLECQSLQRNGIPKPYQYHGIKEAKILNKEIDVLLSAGRNL